MDSTKYAIWNLKIKTNRFANLQIHSKVKFSMKKLYDHFSLKQWKHVLLSVARLNGMYPAARIICNKNVEMI